MSTQTLHLALPPGPVSAKMNGALGAAGGGGRVVGDCKTEERLDEKSGWPPTPATLPHHVCEAQFRRAPQQLTRNPAPLATSEVREGASP